MTSSAFDAEQPAEQPHEEVAVEVPTPEIDLSIYVVPFFVMPFFATLTVSQLERSRRWYVDGLGFVVLATIPGPTGEPALIHLRRWRYQDLLLVPARQEQQRAPSSLAPSSAGSRIRLTFAAHGTDLAQLAATARTVGDGTIEEPYATPWNTFDVLARDPDGHEIVFTSRLHAEQHDPAFAARMEQVRQQMQGTGGQASHRATAPSRQGPSFPVGHGEEISGTL
jgi:catechol 2,3-dioxygenase-like lactoylglutathione lyase family enzyme